ncbi:MAG: 50S ribosomal protein L28 [Patescibacteria group bacterium]|jgi:large subunit ribosomal protein L28|nr:50S ribosomal protein L28 [Patescibacteria group bacterium]
MSRQCDVCGRTALRGNIRSHANNKTKHRQHLNLQSKTLDGKKVKICTKCIKTLNKNK